MTQPNHRWLTAPDNCADTDPQLIAAWVSQHVHPALQLDLIQELIQLNEERQRADAAAAHAFEMQSGPGTGEA